MIKQIISKIKEESHLTDADLAQLGVTQEALSKAHKALTDTGKTDKQADKIILNIWRAQEKKETASLQEMELMGFKHNNDTWTHNSGITITEAERQVLSFTTIESMVLIAKNKG